MAPEQARLLRMLMRTPGIRAIQLADQLNVTLEQAEELLEPEIAAGLVVATTGIAPNGLSCTLYDLSAAFAVTDDYKAMRSAEPMRIAATRLTNVDRAIAFITERGGATSAELHTLLGLKANEYASTYLGAAIKDGRLAKDGKDWTLGSPSATESKEPGELKLDIPAFLKPERQPVPALAPVTAVLTEEKMAQVKRVEPLTMMAAPGPLLFAHWSDGSLQINQAGRLLVVFSPDERRELANFIQQMPASGWAQP